MLYVRLMKIYWGTKDIPEIAGLPFEQQWEIWWACFPMALRHWQTWFGFSILILGIVLGMTIRHFLPFGLGYPISVVVILGGAVIYYSMEVEQLRPYFREYLRRRRV